MSRDVRALLFDPDLTVAPFDRRPTCEHSLALRAPRVFRKIAIGVVCWFFVSGCWAQRPPNWRVYRVADGLPESACIALTITSQGKVLARHLTRPLLSELDGYSLTIRPAPDLGKGRIYQSPGGQLWTAVAKGLLEFRSDSWFLHPIQEIASEQQSAGARVIDPVPLLPIRQGLLLFVLRNGLWEFNSEDMENPHTVLLRSAGATGLGAFSGMSLARDGGLWVSGARGVAKLAAPIRSLQAGSRWREYLLPAEVSFSGLEAPHDDLRDGVITLAGSLTNHQRLLAWFDGQTWSFQDAPSEKLRQAWRGPDQRTWAMTIDALFQSSFPGLGLRESEDISARQYFDLAVEPSGAFWLATSDGLFRYAPLLWRAPPGLRGLTAPIFCLTGDPQGRLWFATGDRLHVLQNGQLQQYPLPGAGAGRLLPRALFLLGDGTLVLAADEAESSLGDQFFGFDPDQGIFQALPLGKSGTKLKVLGMLKDRTLCIQKLFPGGAGALERFDGHQSQSLPDPPPYTSLGTNLSCAWTAQNGDLWLGGELGAAWYHDHSWHVFSATEKTAPAAALFFIEFPDGRVWAATQEQIWEFDGHNWSVIRRGFDRISALARTRDGSVWVGSNNGVERFQQGAWVQNGQEEGLPGPAVRELFEDQQGLLWAGTSHGLVQFHPDADPDPPQTVIEEVSEYGNYVPPGGTVSFAFHGQDKWKYTQSDRLLYSWRLDEHDWSLFQEVNQKSFSELPAGKHVLQVRAMDRNCNIEARAVKEFAVVLPWYRESRLVLISATGLAAALFFAGLAFNRHRRLLRSYAEVERKVAERTQQLEMASRELFHSQKMNALGTLAAGIAHDFNNILSIIKGSAQIIEDNLDNVEKVRTRADRIRTVVEQGAGIVKAMLGFSRESAGQVMICDLNSVVEETLKLLGDRFLREVEVSFQPAVGLPGVLASKDFIQQILLNFIFNAAESMDKNKQIVLTTARLEKLPVNPVLPPAAAPLYVAVSVQDFGCGIADKTLPHVFDPFFTTKALSAHRGTGLGLSMVYELAKRLDAGLTVATAVGQGSTFSLVLPVLKTSPDLNP